MPNDSFVQLQPDSSGKLCDTSQVTDVNGNVVQRQRVVIADDSMGSQVADLIATPPFDNTIALTVRNIPSLLTVAPVAAEDGQSLPVDVVGSEGDSLLAQALDENSGIRLSVGPSLANAGQQPAAQSLPVALANEHILDKFIQGAPHLGALNGNLLSAVDFPQDALLDCLQYRSISFQITTSGALTGGTVTFEASNSGGQTAGEWVSFPVYDMATPTNVPVTSLAMAAGTSRFFVAPVSFRYFRARITVAITGGPAFAFTRLSMTPFVPFAVEANIGAWGGTLVTAGAAPSVTGNITQLSGTALVTEGVAGVLSVGGPAAVGVSPGLNNPNVVAGTDFAGLIRRVMTDVLGTVVVGGQDFRNSMNEGVNKNPLVVRLPNTDQANERVEEMLFKLLVTMQSLVFYVRELPIALAQTLNPATPIYSSDEPDAFMSDPTITHLSSLV
jgi:hypothetical protein